MYPKAIQPFATTKLNILFILPKISNDFLFCEEGFRGAETAEPILFSYFIISKIPVWHSYTGIVVQ